MVTDTHDYVLYLKLQGEYHIGSPRTRIVVTNAIIAVVVVVTITLTRPAETSSGDPEQCSSLFPTIIVI